jgi:cysteine desulfurase
VIAAVLKAMRSPIGNPASAHSSGAKARRLLETARDRTNSLVGGSEPGGVIFVSGGTEANNCVIGSFARNPLTTFIAAPVDHASILEPLRNRCADRVSWIRVDSAGCIDPADIGHAVANRTGPLLLILQAVNSETGVIQPVAEIVRSVRRSRPGIFIHLDAAQAVGRIPLDMATLDVDSLSFSGHKLHGPLGTGVLMVRDTAETGLQPLILGGGQERGLRSGTPNVPGIVGLGLAAQIRAATFNEANRHMRRLRDAFENTVLDGLGEAAAVNGSAANRVSNTSNLLFRFVDGMQMLAHLDAAGVIASQGSACSSGRPEPSQVLRSMGLTEQEAFSSLRFSFSILNTEEEVRAAAETVIWIARTIAQ